MLTKDQIHLFNQATNNEFHDGTNWLVNIVFTYETLVDFISAPKQYQECTKEKFGEIGGFVFVAWREVQVKKGEQRRPMTVVDFGNIRAVFNDDFDAIYN